MKKIIILFLLGIFVISCGNSDGEVENDEQTTDYDNVFDTDEMQDEDEAIEEIILDIDPDCIPDCEGKSCGDENGCGFACVPQTCGTGKTCSIDGECVSTSSEVFFRDKNLKKEIAKLLGKEIDDPITIKEMETIEKIEFDRSVNVVDHSPLYYCASLKTLMLLEQPITQIHPNLIKPMKSLEEFYLEKYEKDLIYINSDFFKTNISIEMIYLGENGLKKIHPHQFEGLVNLKHLSMMGNNFETLPDGIFDDLVELDDLRVDVTKPLNLEVFSPLKNIWHINVYAPSFEGVFPEIPVSQLFIRCDFCTLENETFFNVKNVSTLSLKGLGNKKLSNTLVSHLTELDDVSFGYGLIESIERLAFEFNPFLETVYFNNNYLSDLPDDLFNKNLNLEKIDLSSNCFPEDFEAPVSSNVEVIFEDNPSAKCE